MGKILQSPVARYPGTVTIPDYLVAEQDLAFEDAMATPAEIQGTHGVGHYLQAILPGVIACVTEWNLANFPEHPTLENFPRTPRKPVTQLVSFLVTEISKVYTDGDSVPNE